MKLKNFLLSAILVLTAAFIINGFLLSAAQAATGDHCKRSFFGIPTWYEFLKLDNNCNIDFSSSKITETDSKGNTKIINKPSVKDIWLIVLAIIDILATLAGILAVIFIMIGGFKYVTSQANPDKITGAKNTLLYAIIGLVIAIVATQIITYFGKALGT